MPTSCCPPGSWDKALDSLGSQDAKGALLKVGRADTPIYYTPPSVASNKGVIVFTDVYGFSPRFFSICDIFAEKGGYHVISPDCFRGETKDKHLDDVFGWMATYPYESLVSIDIASCLDFLAQKGVSKERLGTVGFCWGGWVIAKSGSNGIPWKVGVSPHPSTKAEEVLFGMDETKMIENVNFPLLLLPAGNDRDNLKPGGELATILEAKGGGSILFSEMKHGWVTRGDLSQEAVKRDADLALSHTLEFLQKHL